MKKPKTVKYIVRTYHGDAFYCDLEVSKKTFCDTLEALREQAKQECLEANEEYPNERGEYYNTRFEESDQWTKEIDIFGCGTSETLFIKWECKGTWCFK